MKKNTYSYTFQDENKTHLILNFDMADTLIRFRNCSKSSNRANLMEAGKQLAQKLVDGGMTLTQLRMQWKLKTTTINHK